MNFIKFHIEILLEQIMEFTHLLVMRGSTFMINHVHLYRTTIANRLAN